MGFQIRNPENIALWKQKFWALEYGIELKESGIPLTKFHWQKLESITWNPESMAWNPESKTDSFTWSDIYVWNIYCPYPAY